MNVWCRVLVFWIACSIAGIAQQPALSIKEEELPAHLKADTKVSDSLRNLKTLRRRLDAMGAKHPSRKQFEESLRKEEELLRQRILELTPEVKTEPSELVPSPIKEPMKQAPGTEVLGPQTPSSKQANESLGSTANSDQMAQKSRELLGVAREDLLFEEIAFPWIDSSGFTALGCFVGKDKMWGVEPHYNEEGLVESGTIWQWADRWRERTTEVFWRCKSAVLAFCPSSRVATDGLWFIVCRDPASENPQAIELWVHQGWPDEGESSSQQLLLRGVVSTSARVSLHYDCDEKKLLVGVLGELKVTQRPAEPLVEVVLVDGSVVLSSVAYPNDHQAEQVLRPFWRKRGAKPSVSPKWWNHRNQRIVHHPYKEDESPFENGRGLWSAISKLKPGDTLLVQPGVYSSQARLDLNIIGESSAPIVIQGNGPGVIITRPDATENVINIVNASFAAIGGVEVTGGSTGIRIQTAQNLMIYNTTIHNVGNVGVSLNFRSTSEIYIVDNEIYSTSGNGEGIYAGSNDGTRITHNSYFVGNYIHDLASGKDNQGDGIEVKNRSYGNTIKWNYIVGTKYPGITAYTVGEDGKPVNVIEENVILDSSDSGIQATADALVQNNWLSGNKIGIVSKPFGRIKPRNIKILGNTVLGDMVALKLTEWNRSDAVIANNFLYSKTRNYFHSGYGRAIYLSNQLVCDLEDGVSIESITTKTSNRLLTSSDIFGKTRPTFASIGAMEYRDSGTKLSEESDASGGHRCFAFDSRESTLLGMSFNGSDRLIPIACVGPNDLPLAIENPLLQVIRLSNGVVGSFKEVYLVSLLDVDSRILYQGVLRAGVGSRRLVMTARYSAQVGGCALGVTSHGELLLVGPEGCKTLLTPEFQATGYDARP